MLDSRDPAIKLFGTTIPLPTCDEAPAGSSAGEEEKDLQSKETSPESNIKDHKSPETEEKTEPATSSTSQESPKTSSVDQENSPKKDLKPDEPSNETNDSQEKALKKPNKILPCPRCKSLDTKFCYYNNYNINQPRHFCKNCQRYWTDGGTMRNVPVGAGRRKSKNSASYYGQITMPDACLPTIQSNVIPQSIHSPMKPNGTVLNFGFGMPLCESMASVLNLAEKTMKNGHRNGFQRIEEKIIPSSSPAEHANEQLSSVTPPTMEGIRANLQEPILQNSKGTPAPFPCFNGSPWPYPWSSAPTFCSSSFPFPVYPATTYWGCTMPGPWAIPWFSPGAISSSKSDSSGSGPNSPNLGKHSREGDVLKHFNSERGDDIRQRKHERSLWVPKTLRIDNPDEAAKSSIWATIGIRNDKSDATGGAGLFKSFHPKAEMKNYRVGASQFLHANPAALSRALNFQEST